MPHYCVVSLSKTIPPHALFLRPLKDCGCSVVVINCCRRWVRTIDARVNHPPLYSLSYTAYRCSVCCDIIATISLYTSLPPPPREPLRDVCQCYRIYSSFQSLPSRSSRLAQVFHSASFLDGKTSLTSFSQRSWIVSLSLAYPASGWVIFYVPICQ